MADGRKRARADHPSELDAKLAGQVGAAKKVCLAMDAVGAAVEGLGEEEKSVSEKEGEKPLRSQKERRADVENHGKDDEFPEFIHENGPPQLDVGRSPLAAMSSTEAAPDDTHPHIETVQPGCAEESIDEGDPVSEENVTFVNIGKDYRRATVGPRCFTCSMDMSDFFYRLLHGWPLNMNINEYEHMMLEDLLKMGHHEWRKKVGPGIKAFQVRINREFGSRCFYVIRKDGSTKDFSYRKCVDNLLPLPRLSEENILNSNKEEKGFESLLNNKVSEAQGSESEHNTRSRGSMLDKDRRGSGRSISRHIKGRGNHCGHGVGNVGGSRRGKHGGWGRGKRTGLINRIGGASCKF